MKKNEKNEAGNLLPGRPMAEGLPATATVPLKPPKRRADRSLNDPKQKDRLLHLRLHLVEFSAGHSLDELLQETLDRLEEVTGSVISFFNFVEEDQKTLTLQAWSSRTEKEFCRMAGKGIHYGVDQAGVWVDCVHTGKPEIHNDYSSLPNRRGLPEGHATLNRELVVPVIRNDRVLAILGLGNKPTPYTEEDVETVTFLADVCWQSILQKRTEDALRQSVEQLEQRVAERTEQLQQEIEAGRKYQAALQEGELKFHTVADWTYDWESWSDPQGRYLYVSPSARRITGYSADAFLTDPGMMHRIVHPDDCPLWEQHLRENHVEGHDDVSQLTFRLITASGDYRWIEHICQPVYDPDGRYGGRRASNRDITDKMEISLSLAQEQQRLARILEGINAGTWEWNVQTGETIFNERWAQICGYTLEELAPISIQTWLDKVHPDDLKVSEANLQRHFSGAADYYECRCRMRHKNGSWVWVQDRGKVSERTPEGKPLKMSGIHTDITLRKRAEEELQISQANFRAFFDLSMEFLFVLDLHGTILKANRSVYSRLGYAEGEVIGQPVLMMHPPERRAEAGCIVQAMLAGEREFCPLPLQARDGRHIPVETRIIKGVWDGNPALFGVSKDVSELAFSEEKFAKAFDTSPSLMAISDRETGQIIDVNQSWLSTLGFAREEVIGRTARDLKLFQDIARRDAIAAEVSTAECSRGVEMNVRDKNGGLHIGEFSAQIISVRGRDHLLTVMNDVTARKRADEEIKRQTSLITSLLDSIPDIIFFKDLEGGYLGCNPSFTQFVGKAREEIVGKTDYDLFDKDTADFFREQDKCMLELRRPRHNEEWITYPDGRKVLVDTLKTPYLGVGGTLIGVLGISRDVTERQQAEAALQQATNRLSLAVRASGIGIWDYDVVNNHLTWDEQMFRLYGTARDQFGGAYEAWQAGLHPDDRQRGDEEIQMALGGAKEFDTEFRVVRPDGMIRNIRALALVQRDTSGQPTHMIGTNWDITESKWVEEQLLLTSRSAEAANQAKSVFLANMSHELRTPMGGMLGMTALLLGTTLTDRQRHYAERIKMSGESLLVVLNDILDFSKVEAGKLTLESIPFPLQEVIGNVTSIFTSQVLEKGIRLQTDLDPELPATLLGDPQRLTQVINNLTGNAVKFTEAGDVRLSAKARRRTDAGLELEISVHDTGIGMSEEELSRLFKAFSQADASTTRRFGGSGLGLTISRQLVELMGGTLHVESAPGKGSVFTALIPFPVVSDVRMADLHRLAKAPRERFSGVQALVAEDHAINREVIVELLRQFGIEADIAADGRRAVELVRTGEYDIVFMDIQMPGMDGFMATREIRQLDRKGIDRLPIIAMTAHAIIGDREKSLAVGMNEHLTKPINPDALGETLRRWLPQEKCSVTSDDGWQTTAMSDHLFLPSMQGGPDLEEALNRLGGNRALFLKLLADFVAGYGETPEQLIQELRADRREEAVLLVHSIKGIAGNIGGKELATAAQALEKACRTAGSGIPFSLGEPLRVFIDRHEALIGTIGAFLATQAVVLPAKPEEEPPGGGVVELRLLLEGLRKALVSEEPRPCNKILGTLLKRRWSKGQEASLAELNRLVQRYLLAEALALLDKEFGDILKIGMPKRTLPDHANGVSVEPGGIRPLS